jgi:hypothetical protein
MLEELHKQNILTVKHEQKCINTSPENCETITNWNCSSVPYD